MKRKGKRRNKKLILPPIVNFFYFNIFLLLEKEKMKIPTEEECLKILKDNKTPSNVIEHSKVVCRLAVEIADKLEKKGMKINRELIIAASLLHDIQRVEDDHIVEGVNLLNRLGFPKIAEIIKKHGLTHLHKEEHKPVTIEEKIVFYADKRIKGSEIVSLKERFEYIEKKYNKEVENEFEFTKKIEEELNQ